MTEELQQQLASAASSKKPTDTKLSPEQLQEVSEGSMAVPAGAWLRAGIVVVWLVWLTVIEY